MITSCIDTTSFPTVILDVSDEEAVVAVVVVVVRMLSSLSMASKILYTYIIHMNVRKRIHVIQGNTPTLIH